MTTVSTKSRFYYHKVEVPEDFLFEIDDIVRTLERFTLQGKTQEIEEIRQALTAIPHLIQFSSLQTMYREFEQD